MDRLDLRPLEKNTKLASAYFKDSGIKRTADLAICRAAAKSAGFNTALDAAEMGVDRVVNALLDLAQRMDQAFRKLDEDEARAFDLARHLLDSYEQLKQSGLRDEGIDDNFPLSALEAQLDVMDMQRQRLYVYSVSSLASAGEAMALKGDVELTASIESLIDDFSEELIQEALKFIPAISVFITIFKAARAGLTRRRQNAEATDETLGELEMLAKHCVEWAQTFEQMTVGI